MTGADALSRRHIYSARRTMAPWIAPPPLVQAPTLSPQLGEQVFLKLETVQPTASFKIRGATNRLERLSPGERSLGVVTVSTGNHGRAVAHAARRLGIRAVVCVSE